MSNLNSVVVSGRLTRDPELRHIPSGTAVCELGLANNRSKKTADGGFEDEASFFDVSVWSGRGEVVARKLRKGDFVTVQGRLQQRRWEAEDGTKREKVSIIADNIEGEGFFRSKDEDAATSTPEASDAPAPAAADDDIPF